jgi:CheY-like chemotaxis protein
MRLEILLVEDAPAQVYLVRMALERWKTPYNLNVAATAEEALEFIYRRHAYSAAPRPHLILLDLNLPQEPGFTVLSAIKGDPALRDIAVIVLSSSAAQSDIERAMDLHANAYFCKPANLHAIERMFGALESFWRMDARFVVNPDSGSISRGA